jgi:hypothetical protein
MSVKLNREGFITGWLISGPKIGEFEIDNPFDDQLRFEKHMRGVLRDNSVPVLPQGVILGAGSGLDMPWRYSGGGSRYVDVSFFYHIPKRVELYAYTEIIAGEDKTFPAELWTYAAIDLWLNGNLACTVERPVYKPITRRQMTLPLKKGKNSVFVRMQNLGVRDTRSIFALQFRKGADALSFTLPGPDAEGLLNIDLYLQGIFCNGDTLLLPPNPPGEITVEPAGTEFSGNSIKLPPGTTRAVIKGRYGSHIQERVVEVLGNIRPSFGAPDKGEAQRRKDIISRIAHNNKPGNRFIILNVLARYALGENDPGDRETILKSLEYIDERIDCSDFIAAGIIRLVKSYSLDQDLLEKIRETFIHYRFWMDESGSDGMCFWSENHALLFHGAQLLAGAMYSGDVFTRSGRTGREQADLGLKRCGEWLADIKADGFEEFLSSGYMCVTIGALLNLVDFAPEPISSQAAEITDMLLEQLCRHAFKGSVIGPQGRVYRDVIFPFLQGTQSLLHYIDPSVPLTDNDWPVFFATTKYKPPACLKDLMTAELSERYSCGNGEIVLYKRKNYVLSSAASPRQDTAMKWRNISFDSGAEKDSYRYTKSLNERFHGTTDFRPGVFGYQQHFWYAALNSECIAFTSLPGGDVDHSSMRPGYWYGSGIFPAVKQDKNMLGAVYNIPETYPINFTHLFFPSVKYDEYRLEEGWLFARKDKGWLGIWCSVPLEWHNDMLFKSELRAYADRTAYLCICSDATQDGSFDAFTASCRKLPVRFDEGRMFLSCGDTFSLRYAVHFDHTQYI